MKDFTYKVLLFILVAAGVASDLRGYAGVAVPRVCIEQVAGKHEKVVGDQPTTSAGTGVDDENWTPEQMGKMDADKYYNHWREAKTWTFVITALFGGIVGLIPAIIMSSKTPKRVNLGYPRELLMQDARYRISYEKQARWIKGRKVWGGFGIGLIVAVVFYLALIG